MRMYYCGCRRWVTWYAISNLIRGETIVNLMNLMGYDVMVPETMILTMVTIGC